MFLIKSYLVVKKRNRITLKAARLLNFLLCLCYFSIVKNPFGWKSLPITFFEIPF